jgi:hypothetical protein
MKLNIKCPDSIKYYYDDLRKVPQPRLFIAGGITDCPNWQSDYVKMLDNVDNLITFNPRRDDFNVYDTDRTQKQVEWEFLHLNTADAVSFWFPKEALCPITLYELGYWLAARDAVGYLEKDVFIGIHPEYKRRIDVEVQVSLARDGITIVSTLEDLAEQISEYARQNK